MKNVFNSNGVTDTDPTNVLSICKFIELSSMIPTICENSVVDNAVELDTDFVGPSTEFVNDSVVVVPVVSSNLLLLSFPNIIIVRFSATWLGWRYISKLNPFPIVSSPPTLILLADRSM